MNEGDFLGHLHSSIVAFARSLATVRYDSILDKQAFACALIAGLVIKRYIKTKVAPNEFSLILVIITLQVVAQFIEASYSIIFLTRICLEITVYCRKLL